MKTLRTSLLLAIMLLAALQTTFAQENQATIDAAERSLVVDSIAKFMTDYYVFPDKGKEMADLVVANLKAGKYDEITDPVEFSQKLSEDLLTINNDRHIGVRYMPERIALMKKAEEDENNHELEELEKRMNEFSNYNFEEIKILPGNVGYLKFNSFQDASVAGPTAVAAMNFLAHTDALIIDLTGNGGGSPSLIQLITTYFFDESEHLNSFYIREGDRTKQFWTLTHVPGERMTETDIYVLTSSFTFSGAEEFTYNLKNLKRATIVGETTGGGAHPVAGHIINDNFIVRVPFGRAINPITNTNWEGTGIEPHVKASRASAKNVAYMMALDSLMKKEQNENIRNGLKWAYDGMKAALEPVVLGEKTMKTYAGNYGPRNIYFENGELYYQREERPKMKMVPITETLFGFDELDYFRLHVIVEDGKAVALEGMYDNGATDRNERTK
ncbi:MAG TPA: S41 family peptidase [Bacteroidales bacterium]|nr:S41 family peptidase [Bacteroidales bacterium]